MMLIVRIIDTPLPTPYSVIFSPSHIRKAEPAVIATLETAFRRDERILRFLTTRLDKYAYEYSEKRRHNKTASVEPKVEEA